MTTNTREQNMAIQIDKKIVDYGVKKAEVQGEPPAPAAHDV